MELQQLRGMVTTEIWSAYMHAWYSTGASHTSMRCPSSKWAEVVGRRPQQADAEGSRRDRTGQVPRHWSACPPSLSNNFIFSVSIYNMQYIRCMHMCMFFMYVCLCIFLCICLPILEEWSVFCVNGILKCGVVCFLCIFFCVSFLTIVDHLTLVSLLTRISLWLK